tara:strand:+ start:59 stop:1480 length:1422 start_codon:yes stop_codon:yes gene_type:complete
MLNKLRGFTNTKLAGVLIAIIIIPFVFWGMGSVFSGGNTNNIAKINNETISTKEFIDYVNRSNLNIDIIKKNIDNNILEEILGDIISNKLLNMEIKKLKVSISDKELVNKIKSNKVFQDEKNNFSRLKYEKYLLERNISAPEFEKRLKNQELKKKMFDYMSGGVKSPYFLKNKIFTNETKQIELDYFNLNNSYDNKVSNSEINEFIQDNEDKLKVDYIDFLYAEIRPNDLLETDDFSNEFFKKIDEIENDILNDLKINEIEKKYNLKLFSKNNFISSENDEKNLKEIYSKRSETNIQLIDKDNYFLLFKIEKVNKILPNKSDSEFIEMVKNNILLKKKFDLHEELFKKIQNKELDSSEFNKIAIDQNNIKNVKINGITDVEKFDDDSIKLLYSLPKNSFTLITSKDNNIYLAKIRNIILNSLSKNDQNIDSYTFKSNSKIINDIYNSYDFSLNSKYKVKIFETTLDRVKNYFR